MLPFAFLAVVSLLLAAWGGGIFPGPLHTVCIIVCVGAIVAGRRKLPDGTRTCAPTLLALLILLLIAATAIPLPGVLSGLMGSLRADQNALAAEAIDMARELNLVSDGAGPRFSFTRHRAGTLKAVLLGICCLGAMVLASSIPGELKRRYLAFMVIAGTVIVLLGDVSQWVVPQGKRIWWIPAFTVHHGRPVGCFVNRNHFGGFAGIHALLAAGLMGDSIRRRKTASMVGWGVLFLLLSISVFTSLSRGAAVAYAAGLVVLLATASLRRCGRMVAGIVVCAGIAVAAGAFAYGVLDSSDGLREDMVATGEQVVERMESLQGLEEIQSARSRLSTWNDCLAMWRDHPIFGVGVNGMRMVYQRYETLATRKQFFNAENEYVQLLAETGLIGLALAVWLVFLLLRNRVRGGEAVLSDELRLAITAGLVSILAHASVEFALRRPVYAVAACSLVGLRLVPQVPCAKSYIARWLWPAACAGVLISIFWIGPVYRFDEPDVIVNAPASEIAKSLEWAPTSAQAWYDLGRAAWERGGEMSLFGEKCISTAVAYDPHNYLVWEQLGHIRLYLGDKQGAAAAYARMHEIRPWKQIPDSSKVGP